MPAFWVLLLGAPKRLALLCLPLVSQLALQRQRQYEAKIFKFDFSGMTNHSNVASNVLIFKKGLEFSTKTLGIVKIHTYKFFLIYFGS